MDVPVTGPAVYGLVLETVSEPQDTTPFSPVRDRVWADSVPNTEAPLVDVWESEGANEVRAKMLLNTASTAGAITERFLRKQWWTFQW